jgi:hypothetical protein
MPESNREQRRRSRQQEAVLLGGDFGLGAVQKIVRARDYGRLAAWGFLLGVLAVIVGLPVVGVVGGAAHTPTPKEVVAAAFGGLFLLGCLLLSLGVAISPVDQRLFWYSGGLAELARDEREPRIVRWADVETVTVIYRDDDEAAPELAGCVLRASTEPR